MPGARTVRWQSDWKCSLEKINVAFCMLLSMKAQPMPLRGQTMLNLCGSVRDVTVRDVFLLLATTPRPAKVTLHIAAFQHLKCGQRIRRQV